MSINYCDQCKHDLGDVEYTKRKLECERFNQNLLCYHTYCEFRDCKTKKAPPAAKPAKSKVLPRPPIDESRLPKP